MKFALLWNTSSMDQLKSIYWCLLTHSLVKSGLNPNKVIGFATDTCATLTCVNCGAFVSLKKKIPHVVHLVCLNHGLYLSLLMSFKSSNDIIFAIELLSGLKSIFKMSPKRDSEFEKILEKKNYSKLLKSGKTEQLHKKPMICKSRWKTCIQSILFAL